MNNIYDDYINGITRFGRITMLLGVIVSILPPAIMTWGYGFNPGFTAIIAGAISQISVSGAFYFSEPISYFPIVGRSGLYMGFLSGNLVNMRIPAAVLAQEGSGYKSGSNEGSIMGTIGIGVSVWVGVAFVLAAVVAGQALLSALPDSVMNMLSLIIPALYGGVFAQFAIKSPKTGIFALAVAFVMINVVKFIPGQPSFIITLVAVFSSIAFAKRQLVDKIDKEDNDE